MLWEKTGEVSVFKLRASLEEASTRDTEFADLGRVVQDGTQRTGTLGTAWIYNLAAGTFVELTASHARVSYDTPSLVGYGETRGSGVYGFESSPVSRYRLTTGISRLNPNGSGESASLGEIGLGYEVDIRQGTTLKATVGAVHTNAPIGMTKPVGALSLDYKGERVSYTVAWSREISADGLRGRYARSEGFDASLTYPFTAYTSLALGIRHARSLEADRDVGVTAFARFRSELTRFWAFTLGLEQRRSMPLGGPTARGNSVAVGFVYSNPDF